MYNSYNDYSITLRRHNAVIADKDKILPCIWDLQNGVVLYAGLQGLASKTEVARAVLDYSIDSNAENNALESQTPKITIINNFLYSEIGYNGMTRFAEVLLNLQCTQFETISGLTNYVRVHFGSCLNNAIRNTGILKPDTTLKEIKAHEGVEFLKESIIEPVLNELIIRLLTGDRVVIYTGYINDDCNADNTDFLTYQRNRLIFDMTAKNTGIIYKIFNSVINKEYLQD